MPKREIRVRVTPKADPVVAKAIRPLNPRGELALARGLIEVMKNQRGDLAELLGIEPDKSDPSTYPHLPMLRALQKLVNGAAKKREAEVCIGDAVRLKHDTEYGKTPMTVVGEDTFASGLIVGWLDGNSHMQTATVSKAALVKLG